MTVTECKAADSSPSPPPHPSAALMLPPFDQWQQWDRNRPIVPPEKKRRMAQGPFSLLSDYVNLKVERHMLCCGKDEAEAIFTDNQKRVNELKARCSYKNLLQKVTKAIKEGNQKHETNADQDEEMGYDNDDAIGVSSTLESRLTFTNESTQNPSLAGHYDTCNIHGSVQKQQDSEIKSLRFPKTTFPPETVGTGTADKIADSNLLSAVAGKGLDQTDPELFAAPPALTRLTGSIELTSSMILEQQRIWDSIMTDFKLRRSTMPHHGSTAINAAAVAAQERDHDALDNWSQRIGVFTEDDVDVSFYFHGRRNVFVTEESLQRKIDQGKGLETSCIGCTVKLMIDEAATIIYCPVCGTLASADAMGLSRH